MPPMPALETDEIVQDDDDTFAVVFARTGTMVQLDGVPPLGLALDGADDVADHLEAIAEARTILEANAAEQGDTRATRPEQVAPSLRTDVGAHHLR